MILGIKGKMKGKQIQVVGGLLGLFVAASALFYFFHAEKGGSREKDGGDCKLCQSAVLYLYPL